MRSGRLETFEKAGETTERADDLLVDLNQRDAPSDVIGNLEFGQINLGFIRPSENIGSLHFFSMRATNMPVRLGVKFGVHSDGRHDHEVGSGARKEGNRSGDV